MLDEVKNDAQVSVTLLKDGSLYMNDTKVTDTSMVDVLSTELRRDIYKNKHVIFRGDKGVLMKDVAKIMMKCHEAEVAALTAAGVPPEKMDIQVSIGTTLAKKQ